MVHFDERFERVVQQILGQTYAVLDDFWPPSLLADLRRDLAGLSAAHGLRQAAIGADNLTGVRQDIRSDLIAWWPDAPEDAARRDYLAIVDGLSAYLNRTCYAGIRGREFHFAVYPPGARYARHIDDFANKNARLFSIITYLNIDWQPADGGELVIYGPGDASTTIAPVFGRTVIFPSGEVEHEVLRSHAPRFSITGWLRKN
jgi:SM-20-related protein